MRWPLYRIKNQPWKPLALVAAGTVLAATILERLVYAGIQVSPGFGRIFGSLFGTPIAVVCLTLVGFGVGVLGVWACDRWTNVYLNVASLWALVLCLLVAVWLKSQLPLPPLLVNFARESLIGMLVGVFWKGRALGRWRR